MTKQPLTARGQQTRARIVEAAARVMAAEGVEGATCDEILAAARASKSQLYHYFDGKDELVHAVIGLRFEEAVSTQLALLEHLDSLEGLRAWFDWVVETNVAAGMPGCVLGTLAAEIADRDDTARDVLAGCFEALEGYVVRGLTAMQERGELAVDASPEAVGSAVFAAMQGGLLQAKARRRPELLGYALDAAEAYVRSFATTAGRELQDEARGTVRR